MAGLGPFASHTTVLPGSKGITNIALVVKIEILTRIQLPKLRSSLDVRVFIGQKEK